jgi:S-adenosylmethionine:tRNA ribosyltransferase-isomerase
MRLEDFDYSFDESLIAQHPIEPRDRARLLVVDRSTGSLAHHRFAELPTLLRPNDLLVLNDTQVIPARLPGRKRPSGGKVEVLLVRPGEIAGRWHALVRGHVRSGQQVELPHGILASVTTAGEGGHAVIAFPGGLDVLAYAEKAGQVPLPPYIHRAPVEDDRIHYQTVFARHPGAVAAPTAGLHFTQPLLQALTAQGVRTEYVTLHVGPGTFKPVTCEDVRRHVMDPEWYELPAATAKLVNETRAAGGRNVAVGSTAVRVLETAAQKGWPLEAGAGETSLFIYPGFRFSVVDVLLTNFHLPKSTLFMLVCAVAGRERMLEAYRVAAAEKYRFYSYGDAMLIV